MLSRSLSSKIDSLTFTHRCVWNCGLWIVFAELCSIFFWIISKRTIFKIRQSNEQVVQIVVGLVALHAREWMNWSRKNIDKKTHLCCWFIRFAAVWTRNLGSCCLFLKFRFLTRTRLFSFSRYRILRIEVRTTDPFLILIGQKTAALTSDIKLHAERIPYVVQKTI